MRFVRQGIILLWLSTFLCVLGTFCSTGVTEAAAPPEIRAGGKGATEAAALTDMRQAALKKVLGQLTAWSDDPKSPYQQLLGRYLEFVGKEKIEKRGNSPSGCFVLGKVPVNVDLVQSELAKLVTVERKRDEDARTVYLFIRFMGASHDASERRAEQTILARYNTRLKESGFDVADEDAMLVKLPSYHGLPYEEFVAQVQKELANEVGVTVAVVGEICMTAMEEDKQGTTASCDINIKAFDCVHGFKLITNYEGSDIIRRKTREESGKFLLEKAAITSAKAISDKLVLYWKGQK